MIGARITQEFRIECDRCGTPAGYEAYQRTIPKALKFAEAMQFHCTAWLEDGCPRELWLCPECFRQVKAKEATQCPPKNEPYRCARR